ncbi:MAG: hypothetical protein IPF92_30725 [Myxococcales bacterium]|nr:hypothetical protein [Myxococcales bacterium]
MPALLRSSESLDGLWEELVYTEARLLAAGHKPQAAATSKSLKRLEALQAGQRAAWRREIVAQATVDVVDDALDDEVETLGRNLLHLEAGNRKTARFKQYFKSAVSTVVRLGLESELPVVRGFISQLAKEPEKVLKDHGKAFTALAKSGDEAVAERRDAAIERAAHRAREILGFIDDLNASRTTIHAELTLQATAGALPRDYADRFFRRSTRAARAVDGASRPEPTPPA